MKIDGSVGFNETVLEWELWPKNGFKALQKLATDNQKYGSFSSDTEVSFWIIKYPEDAIPPEGETRPMWVDRVTFKGEGLTYDASGALVGGTITEFFWFNPTYDILNSPIPSFSAKGLDWNVAQINQNPNSIWSKMYEGNDQFDYRESSIRANINLADGDDSLEISDAMFRYGGGVAANLGAGDDFFRDTTVYSGWSSGHPGELILGDGFDDVEMTIWDPFTLSYIQDFNPNEDRIKFIGISETLIIKQVEEGIEIWDSEQVGKSGEVARLFLKGVSADQVKLENGYLIGVNGRDYSRHVNDPDVTQHLHGTTNKDVFVLDGKRDDYRWHATEDGKGIVIWDVKTETPDLLYDFEVLRFNDVSLKLSEWPTSEGPEVEGIRDIADQTQYLQAEEWGETFIIDGKMSDYRWAPTMDKTGTVVWNVKTAKHDILTDFAWITFNDGKADLVQYPRSNAAVTKDQADKDEIVKAGHHREVFEIDGYRDDYSWGANPDGDGIAIWNGSNIDIIIGFDGVRFLDSYADLRALPQWGDIPRPVDEILVQDDPNANQYLDGVTGDEIFVFDGNMADYSWGATLDKKGVVVWNDSGFDILMDYKAVRFNDGTITTDEIRGIGTSNGNGVVVQDVAGVTQFLDGVGDKDQFVIDGNAEDYVWGPTNDETGFVIWNRETKIHDILTDFEEVVFNDQVLVIDDVI